MLWHCTLALILQVLRIFERHAMTRWTMLHCFSSSNCCHCQGKLIVSRRCLLLAETGHTDGQMLQ